MPAPTIPTLASIVSEGLKQAGIKSPSPDLTTRAQEEWMLEIKEIIWNKEKKLTCLQTTSHGILTKGQSRYSMPTDYASDLTVVLLEGDKSGVAQGGGADTIILAADETATENDLIGYEILVTSGTGVASLSQIIAYDESTKEATVAPNFNTAPASGSAYLIVNREWPIDVKLVQRLDAGEKFIGLKRPEKAYIQGDEDFGEFQFDSPPDKVYGARLRYYANILRTDTDSTLMSSLYLRWKNLFTGWITYKALDWGNNTRKDGEFQKHLLRLNELIIREKYGVDTSNVTETVSDFS